MPNKLLSLTHYRLRSTDDFGPKATCSRVQMMANQLGLRSPKCLTKIAEALQAETSGGPFDL